MNNEGLIAATVEHSASETTLIIRVKSSNAASWISPDHTDNQDNAPVARAITSYLLGDRGYPTDKVEWAAFMYGPHGSTNFNRVDGQGRVAKEAIVGSLSTDSKGRYIAGEDLLQMIVNLEYERARNFHYASNNGDDAERRLRIATSAQDALGRLKDALSQILGRSVDFKFFNDERSVHIILDGLVVAPAAWGEGMRSTLAWLTDLLVRLERIQWVRNDISPWRQEFWLLLDEIEESLHPKRQMEILPAIRKLFPNAHIYATTHSPFVVASIGEGHVFSIRPDQKTGRVSGPVHATELKHGQSLEWIVNQVFDAPSGFIDKKTVEELDAHKHDVITLRSGRSVDWQVFLLRRNWLVGLNDEVATTVLMREVSVRKVIDAELDKRRP